MWCICSRFKMIKSSSNASSRLPRDRSQPCTVQGVYQQLGGSKNPLRGKFTGYSLGKTRIMNQAEAVTCQIAHLEIQTTDQLQGISVYEGEQRPWGACPSACEDPSPNTQPALLPAVRLAEPSERAQSERHGSISVCQQLCLGKASQSSSAC